LHAPERNKRSLHRNIAQPDPNTRETGPPSVTTPQLTMPRKSSAKTSSEDRGVDTDVEHTQPLEGHTLRNALLALLKDEDTIQNIATSISESIINKLLKTQTFTDMLIKAIMDSEQFSAIKEDLYQAGCIDASKTTAEMNAINAKIRALEASRKTLEQGNVALLDQLDEQEQYSRRNCLVFHGVTEQQKDTTTAVTDLCSRSLGVTVDSRSIDRSHRLGKPTGDKPRPIIVKFTNYEQRQKIFSVKRKLKGTKTAITENLTRRRSALLQKARSTTGVTAVWSMDGRIVCLTSSGRKVNITTERELQQLGRCV